MMNFRLAQPAVLVDLNNIPELSYIRGDENGGVLVGAMARHKMVGHDPLIAKGAPLIHEAIPKHWYALRFAPAVHLEAASRTLIPRPSSRR